MKIIGFKDFRKAVEHLKKGGIVIYPTETAYGIGCNAANQKAVDLIFKIKRRFRGKSLPLIVGSLKMVKEWVVLSGAEEKLAKKYWPGALTLVLKAKVKKDGNADKLAKGIVAADGSIAVRVSGGKIARTLSQKLGRPIVSTSANLSGRGEIYSAEDLKTGLGAIEKYNIYIIDGGILFKRPSSTIARIDKTGRVKVLRQGEIKIFGAAY